MGQTTDARSTWKRRAAASLGVMGLLCSLLTVLPANPASGHTAPANGRNDTYNGTWPPNNDPGWQVPATNPPISEACGTDIGILVDRSGSIADAGKATQMRDSAKALVDALAGTPSSVGVWSFGDDSSATGTSAYPARQLTEVGGPTGPAGVTSLKSTIDSIPIVSGVATNWEAGFDSVHLATTASGKAPSLLFVLTDGKPTVHEGDDDTGDTTNNDDVDGGIRTANLVKGDHTRVFGVGIGAGIDSSTLGLVANDLAFNGSNITTAGYALTNFDNLQSTLRSLVTELCGGSVTVQKLADPGTGTFSPAPGWNFTLDPTDAQLPNQTKATDAQGQANFKLDSVSSEQVTITEDLASKPGYQFLAGSLVCTNSNGPAPTLTPVTNGAKFTLGPTDIVSCTFKNKKQFVDLGIVKSDGGATTTPGGNVTYTLTYGNKGNAAAPNSVISETVPANATVDLGSGPADGKNDGWVCNGAQNGVFPAGTTCTRNVGTVAAGASGLKATFTVKVDNPVPFGVTQISNTAVISYDNSAGPDTNPTDNTSTDTTPIVMTPQVNVVKTAVKQGSSCPGVDGTTLTVVAGQPVVYCYVVTNPGDGPLLNVTLKDDNGTVSTSDDFTVTLTGLSDQDGDGQADDLAAGGTATGQSAPKTFDSVGTVTNVATATGYKVTGQPISDTDDAVVTVTAPQVHVVKTAVKQGSPCPGIDGAPLGVVTGQGVVYCYVVTNPGNAPLLNVTLKDDNGTVSTSDDFTVTLSGLSDQDGDGQADDLAAGGTAAGQSSPKTFNSVGTVTNVATAAGVSASGKQLSDTDDAVVNVTSPQVHVVKTAVKQGSPCPGVDGAPLGVVTGQGVVYCYVVTNPGNGPLLNVTLKDDNGTVSTSDDFTVTLSGLSDQDGDGQADDLAAGGTATGQSAPKTFNSVGTVTNVATAAGVSASGTPISDTDDAVVNVTAPQINVVKTAVKSGSPCPGIDGVTLVVDEGQQVRYCYVVTNPGNAPLLNVTLKDDNGTALVLGDDFNVTLSGLSDQDGDGQADDLAAGATATGMSGLRSFEPGTVMNVATANGVSASGQQLSDTDTAVVQAKDVPPSLSVTKTANPSSVPEPGGPVTFTVDLKNTSAESVTVTSITDSVDGGSPFSVTSVAPPVTATTCATGGSIAAGATYSCTFTLNVSGDGGDVVHDTVVGQVVDNDGTPATGQDDASVTVTDVRPSVVVTKSADPTSVPEPGGSVTFEVGVKNTSVEPVTVTSITDSVEGGAPFSVTAPATAPVTSTTCVTGGTIAVGATYSCTFTLNVTGDANDVVHDTVVGQVSDNEGNHVSDDDNASVTITDVPPSLVVTKTAETTSVPEPGGPVAFKVDLKNTSAESVTVTSITDSVDGGAAFSVTAPATAPVTATTCATGGTIAAGATYSCTFTLNVAGEGGDVVNDTVVGQVVDNDGTPTTGQDDASVTVTDVLPTVEVTKSANPTSVPEPGGPVTFEVGVKNTSVESVTVTSITDSVEGGAAFSVTAPATAPVTSTTCATGGTIAPGATYNCTFTLNVSGDAGDVIHDTVVGQVADNEGNHVSDDASASVTVTDVPPTVQVTKTADPTSVPEPGGPVTFKIDVKNTSFESVTVTSITDSVEGGAAFSVTAPATAPVTATTCATGSTIAPGATYSCTFTLNVTGDAGDVIGDVVTAAVVDNDGSSVTGHDDASVTVTDVPPSVQVTKTADPTSVPEPGGPVTFKVDMKNTSVEPVTVTSITDSVEGGAPFSVTAPATAPVTATTCVTGGTIAVGATYSCTFTLNVTGDANDVVHDTVVGQVADNEGNHVSDHDTTSVTITDVPPTVVVTKTAESSSVPEPDGPVDFTVELRNTSFESVTVTSITDSVDGGAPFSVTAPATAPVTATTCATGVLIDPGGTYTCAFTLNVAGNAGDVVNDTVVGQVVDNDGTPATSQDDASVTVTDVPPTIVVTKDDGGVSVAAPGGEVTYTVGVKNTSFESVTVTSITDSVDGGAPFSVTAPATDPVLDTTCATGSVIDPGDTYTCTFTVMVEGSGGENVVDTVSASVVDDDATPATGTDDETTPVTPVADLEIQKTTPADTFTVGQQANYTLLVTNHGPSTATNVVVTDTLPAGLSLVSIAAPEGWTCTGTVTINCTTASMVSGSQASLSMTVSVSAAASPNVTNAAQVTADEPDSNPANNRDEVTTPVVNVLGTTQTPTTLPKTGTDIAGLVGMALLFLGGGFFLVSSTRRRRHA